MEHPSLARTTASITARPVIAGDIGVELEIEGENLPREVPGWVAKDETSLRGKGGRTVQREEKNFDTPVEYVCQKPVLFKSLYGKLKLLREALSAKGTSFSLTNRASTHIHLNMTGETLRTVLFFVMLFTMVEPIILRLCGDKRNGNLFCVPSYDSGDLPWWASRVAELALVSGEGAAFSFPQRGKYASLNLDPLRTLGSVEARCFPNSADEDEINRWAGWMVNMRSIAASISDGDALLNRAYQEPRWLLGEIFGDYLTNRIPDAASMVPFGVEQAYEFWKACQPIFDYDPKVKVKKQEVYDDYAFESEMNHN